MNPFFLLAQATTLPPPPAPKSANSVSSLSIVLVVVIVLGSVAMIALASRRFRRRPVIVAEEPAPQVDSAQVIDPIAGEPEVLESVDVATPPVDPNLLARLRRVTGHQAAERRKLGYRKSPSDAMMTPSPGAPSEAASLAADGAVPTAEAMELFPEPIPIRRRTSQRWQDEPVIAPGPLYSGPVRARASVKGAALQGLTSEEVSQLEAPRQTARSAPPLPRLKPDAALARPSTRPSLDELLIAELSATVRELLYCANVGELLHGFSLYSDPFLFRTMDDSGLSEEEFRLTFEQANPKPVGEWTRLASLADLDRLTPELVEATVTYQTPALAPRTAPERFRFVRNAEGQNWLIDDIRPLDR